MSIIPYEKSFASHPKGQYWSDKNTKNPIDVSKKSYKKYWFDCPTCKHSFDSSLSNIVSGNWCPYCSNPPKRLCNNNECISCFEKSFASHEKSIYWSNKNIDENDNKIIPRNVFKSSSKKYWFECPTCKHSFDSSLSNIVNNGRWCPYCSNNRLCHDNECISCFEKSFASYEKSIYWSKKNTENPRDIFKSSNIKYWFDCPDCNHSFDSSLNHIVIGRWCSFCGNRKLCNDNECIPCFEKSFASHEKSIYWSDKNTEKPRDVSKSSHNKYWFVCSVCDHSFDSGLNSIVAGNWCPYCSNNRLCNDNKCISCFEKSFASHEKSIYWSDKNTEKPRDVSKSSHNKYWFDCPDCIQPYYSVLFNIARGHWCSCRKHKTELKLYDILILIYPTLVQQFKEEWCKRIKCLPFDFCIPELKIIIELDGRQHFQQVSNWSSPEEQFENDKYKEKCANDNDYSVIRILQEDVLNDTYDWLKDLCNTIEEIKNGDEVVNAYLCKNGEYECF
jgi:very-short-patch-repair endonuclease